MTFLAEFHCIESDITISADQICDGNNDCPGPDEYDHYCSEETEDEDNNINEISSKNKYPQSTTDTPVKIKERIKLTILFKCLL